MRKWLAYFTLYLTYALDLVGIVVVYIVFAPMILEDSGGFLAAGASVAERNFVVGLLFAAYPLTQFFGAPILGELSDRFGRRPILMGATLATAIAFGLSGVAVVATSLWLLFVSRLVAGFAAGCMTVAQSAAGDMTPVEKRARYMAAFSAVGGVSWTVGPFIGSLLSNKKLVSWFGFDTPFWAMGILFLAAFLGIWFFVDESRERAQPGKMHLGAAFGNLLLVLRRKGVAIPLLASTITLVGWMMYQAYFSTYLIERYNFSVMREGNAYVVSSIGWFFGGVASGWFLRRHHPNKVIFWPLIVGALSVMAFLPVTAAWGTWPLMVIGNFCEGLAVAAFFALYAQLVPSEMLGRIYGSWNAGFALAAMIGPLVSGALSGIWLSLPLLVASLIMLGVAVLFRIDQRKSA